jgi:hypothetical protein
MVESGNRISMPPAVRQSADEIVHTIERNPLPSALTVFGLGVGVGLLATILLSMEQEEPEPWPRRYRRQAMDRASYAADRASHVSGDVANIAQQAAKHAVDGVMHLLRRN